MTFAERETERVYQLRAQLFDAEAHPSPGDKDHLRHGHAQQNLYAGFRGLADAFFDARQIYRHAHGWDTSITSSQVACLNFLFAGVADPHVLMRCFHTVFPSAIEFLPIEADAVPADSNWPYVSFEWIGARNYLQEPGRRERGRFVTNADAVVRFRERNGSIHVVLIEWKYRECYAPKCTRYSKHKTDRLPIYERHLAVGGCQLKVTQDHLLEELFFDPFDQLMRLQFLASAMEHEHEMKANKVSVLLIAPCANHELLSNVTSPRLQCLGISVPAVWTQLVEPGRFLYYPLEKLLRCVATCTEYEKWARYLQLRYGGMK